MKLTPRLKHSSRVLLVPLALLLMTSHRAGAQAQQFRPGEVILYCQPGTAKADVDTVVANVGGTANPMLLADCYLVTLPLASATPAKTLDAVATLKPDPHVRWIGPNTYLKMDANPTATPNDPRLSDQWNLRMIRMPEAWVLQKGAPNTNAAVADSAFDTAHEDMVGQFLAGSYDFGDNDTNITTTQTTNDAQHGQHCAGIIAAKTNNGLGVAGICWQNVKILGLKNIKDSDTTAALNTAAMLNSLAYVTTNKTTYHIAACNMSWGATSDPTDTTNPFYTAIKAAADAGVFMVASAGNDKKSDTSTIPAGYPSTMVCTVSAVGPSRALASYSNFGKIDIAAPGGDQDASGLIPDGVLSTMNGTYVFAQGTSMAAPHVTAVATLIRSSLPTISNADLLAVLKRTAQAAGDSGKFGAGIVDAYSALTQVTGVITIITPNGLDANNVQQMNTTVDVPIETFKPTIQVDVISIDPSTLVIKLDGNTILSGDANVRNAIAFGTAPSAYTVVIRQKMTQGTHTLVVSGTKPSGDPLSDQRTFTVNPHEIPAGLSFVSIPYLDGQGDVAGGGTPPDLNGLLSIDYQRTGTDSLGRPAFAKQLYRYIRATREYALYPNPADTVPANAAMELKSFLDTTVAAQVGTTAPDNSAVGKAFFIRWRSTQEFPFPVLTNGQALTDKPFRVEIRPGWNMVGDPFPFSVAFNSVQFEQDDGSRITTQQALDLKYIAPILYQYVNNDYVPGTVASGTFDPWQGQWVFLDPNSYATPSNPQRPAYLIFTPTPTASSSGRAAAATAAARAASYAPTVSGSGSWSLRLTAQTSSLVDTRNYIGMTTSAGRASAYATLPKAPAMTPYVSLAIARPDLPAGFYSQDLRPLGGAQSWNVAVSSDQKNADVVLTWPNIRSVARTNRLTLTDTVSGQTIDMRTQSSYRFNTGANAAARSFTISAKQGTNGGRPVFTSIVINPNPTRAAGASPSFTIGYTITQDAQVEISVRNASGRTIAHVSQTRAITSGNNQVVWNGRDDSGRAVQAGVYNLQITAITPDGATTRDGRPFVYTGR